jgi:hypothetical protein
MLYPLKCWVTLKNGKELPAMDAMHLRGEVVYFEDIDFKTIKIRLENISTCRGWHGFFVDLRDLISKR